MKRRFSIACRDKQKKKLIRGTRHVLDWAEGNKFLSGTNAPHIYPLTPPLLLIALGCLSYTLHNTPRQGNLSCQFPQQSSKILLLPWNMRFFEPTASAPPAQSVGMGFPTSPSPAVQLPLKTEGKHLLGSVGTEFGQPRILLKILH